MAPNTRGAMVAARIPKELRRQLEELAAQQDRTMSWLIEKAIRNMVAVQEVEGDRAN
jgi:predicted transcriptional regulator